MALTMTAMAESLVTYRANVWSWMNWLQSVAAERGCVVNREPGRHDGWHVPVVRAGRPGSQTGPLGYRMVLHDSPV